MLSFNYHANYFPLKYAVISSDIKNTPGHYDRRADNIAPLMPGGAVNRICIPRYEKKLLRPDADDRNGAEHIGADNERVLRFRTRMFDDIPHFFVIERLDRMHLGRVAGLAGGFGLISDDQAGRDGLLFVFGFIVDGLVSRGGAMAGFALYTHIHLEGLFGFLAVSGGMAF